MSHIESQEISGLQADRCRWEPPSKDVFCSCGFVSKPFGLVPCDSDMKALCPDCGEWFLGDIIPVEVYTGRESWLAYHGLDIPVYLVDCRLFRFRTRKLWVKDLVDRLNRLIDRVLYA